MILKALMLIGSAVLAVVLFCLICIIVVHFFCWIEKDKYYG